MSRRFLLIHSLALFCLPALCRAQAPANPTQTPAAQTQTPAPVAAAPAVIGPIKMAWIDLEQAILACEEGKREFGEVQKYVDKKNQELEALRKELETLKNQLNIQGDKLTNEARQDLAEQIEAKDTNLQRFSADTQKDIDNRRGKTTNYIGRRMLPVIEKLSKEKGLNAVVFLNQTRDAWVDPNLIITDEVIKAYNTAHPVAATPAKKP